MSTANTKARKKPDSPPPARQADDDGPNVAAAEEEAPRIQAASCPDESAIAWALAGPFAPARICVGKWRGAEGDDGCHWRSSSGPSG